MNRTTFPFTRKLLLTVLLATFASQALAATYTYRKYIPGLKETLSTLEARTVPFIDHILPAGGDTAGGNIMAIYATSDGLNPLNGHGFAPGTTVSVDGVLAGSTLQGVVSPGMGASLNVLMPFHAVGTAQVVVTDPRGATVSAPYAYTHDVTVSAVSPATGLVAGTPLTIYGTGFVSGSSVSIDGVPAALNAAYSTQLVATAPTHAPGSATLTVINPDTSTFTFSGLNYGTPASTSFSATTANAGSVAVGQSGSAAPLTVSNPGSSPLTYAALSALPGGWSLATGTGACNAAGGTLPAQAACTLTFSFSPTSVAQGGGAVTFTPTTAGLAATTLMLSGSVPTNTYATWNPADKAPSMALSTGNLTAVGNGSAWASVRATQGKSSGKWYWESTITGGYTTDSGYFIGVGTSSFYLNDFLGNTAQGASGNSFGWGSPYTPSYYSNWPGASIAALPAPVVYPVGTTFMVAMDMDNHAIYVGVNGTWNGGGVPISGAAKTGAALSGFTGTVFPAVSSIQTQSTSNFGATPFKYTAPVGYHAGVFQ